MKRLLIALALLAALLPTAAYANADEDAWVANYVAHGGTCSGTCDPTTALIPPHCGGNGSGFVAYQPERTYYNANGFVPATINSSSPFDCVAATPTPTFTPASTATPAPPTATPTATGTPAPTNTPGPTFTPTVAPTATSTPIPCTAPVCKFVDITTTSAVASIHVTLPTSGTEVQFFFSNLKSDRAGTRDDAAPWFNGDTNVANYEYAAGTCNSVDGCVENGAAAQMMIFEMPGTLYSDSHNTGSGKLTLYDPFTNNGNYRNFQAESGTGYNFHNDGAWFASGVWHGGPITSMDFGPPAGSGGTHLLAGARLVGYVYS